MTTKTVEGLSLSKSAVRALNVYRSLRIQEGHAGEQIGFVLLTPGVLGDNSEIAVGVYDDVPPNELFVISGVALVLSMDPSLFVNKVIDFDGRRFHLNRRVDLKLI